MNDIPGNINVESLPGPKRGSFRALYFRDECIYSHDNKHFALAYSITEASMCNEVGCLIWGTVESGHGYILQNPLKLYASCWQSPWCKWLSNNIFVFKSQMHVNGSVHTPLITVHIENGYSVLPNSNEADIWLPDNIPANIKFNKYNETELITEICNN
jgi:hypothetical protein